MKLRSRMKKLLFASLAAVFGITALYSGAFSLSAHITASAADRSFQSAALSISNGQFNESSSSSFPKEPSQWTGEALSGSAATMYNGVVSMDPGVYNYNGVLESYHWGDLATKPKNPFSDKSMFANAAAIDDGFNALMINTKDANGAFAYTSASVTFEANACYEITVYVLTFGFTKGGASVKLVDAETNLSLGNKEDLLINKTDEKMMAFRGIDTSKYVDGSTLNWRPYTFNIQTSFTPVNAKVWLSVGDDGREAGSGTKGIAFFDNITGATISREKFAENAVKNAGRPDFLSYSFEEEAKERGKIEANNSSFIKNGDFTQNGDFNTLDPAGKKGLYGWERIDYENRGSVIFGTKDKDGRPFQWNAANYQDPRVTNLSEDGAFSPFIKTAGYEDTALRIKHPNGASASGVISSPFTLQRFRYYRISVWFLTLDSAQANIYLSMPNPDYPRESGAPRKTLSSMSALSSADNANTENWQQASFYVKGSAVGDFSGVSLELWLGYGDSKASSTFSSGAVYFDRIEIQYLDTAEYNKYSGNGTAVTLDEFAALSSITNGNFNEFEYEDIGDYFILDNGNSVMTAPLSPASWTFVNGEDTTLNPGAAEFGYNDDTVVRGVVAGGNAALGAPESGDYNTVLRISNGGLSAAGYTSPDISLSSSSYQKISVWVNTSENSKAFLQLTENGNPIALLENIKTGGVWRNYSFIVWTGDGVSLKLTLWNGWCGTQSAPYKNLSQGTVCFAKADSVSATKEDYDAASGDKTVKTVDMNTNFGLFDNTAGSLKTPYRYTLSSADERNVSGGILDTREFAAETISVPNPGSTDNAFRYVLMVNNLSATASKYTSVRSVSLSSSSYYKISVSVKTADLSGTGSSYGACIGLAGVKKDVKNNNPVISGIKSDGKYTVYTFYIATGDEAITFNYELGLGDLSRPSTYTKGFAFFEDMSYATMNPAEYRNATAETGKSVKLSFMTAAAETPENDLGKGFWDWYWLPTLLFGAALLFVFIAIGVRKLIPALASAVEARRRNKAAASYSRGEDEPRRKPSAADDDGYIDVVETVRPKADRDAEAGQADAPDGKAKADDAYDDYFED